MFQNLMNVKQVEGQSNTIYTEAILWTLFTVTLYNLLMMPHKSIGYLFYYVPSWNL